MPSDIGPLRGALNHRFVGYVIRIRSRPICLRQTDMITTWRLGWSCLGEGGGGEGRAKGDQ